MKITLSFQFQIQIAKKDITFLYNLISSGKNECAYGRDTIITPIIMTSYNDVLFLGRPSID